MNKFEEIRYIFEKSSWIKILTKQFAWQFGMFNEGIGVFREIEEKEK